MPHPRDADHFFGLSAGEGAWVLRGAEAREATGTTRAGVEESGTGAAAAALGNRIPKLQNFVHGVYLACVGRERVHWLVALSFIASQ